MENLKIGLFDLFSYAIPGSIAIVISYLLYKVSNGVCIDLTEIMSCSAGFIPTVLFFVGTYLIGFFTSIFGDFIICIVEKIQGKQDNSTKYCMVRELTPENFKSIEQFSVLRKMTVNLSFIILVGSLSFLIIIMLNNIRFCGIGFIVIAGIVVSGLFFISFLKIHRLITTDLDNTIKIYKLKEHAGKYLDKR